MNTYHRRGFLREGLSASTLVALGPSTIPLFLGRSARATLENPANDRVLVVVQLLGGNDGLNTVVPHGIDGYSRGRRALRIPSQQLVTVTPEVGLHPSLSAFGKILERNRLSVIQGVGYPNPDRSHFRSMEIWETARTGNKPEDLATGWVGRALEALPSTAGGDVAGIHVGGRAQPLALKAVKLEVPSLEKLEDFRLKLAEAAADRRAQRQALDDVARIDRGNGDALLGFIRRSTLAAYESSQRLEQLGEGAKAAVTYPNQGLARRLELIAKIIKAGYKTRIYYTALDGFDTHANQIGTHAALLTELADSVSAFEADLTAAGHGDRVSILCFSEFGRRVEENASAGTDHGAAAPVFVLGPVKQKGLVGAHPSMDPKDLDDGDLKFHTDFRRVYADVLEGWLGVPAAPIVGTEYRPIGLFA
jgi:uncharacterized protein (DUF1501 family)